MIMDVKNEILDGDFFEKFADFSYGDIYSTRYHPSHINIALIKEEFKRTPILFINTERLIPLLNVIRGYGGEVIVISHNSDINIGENVLEKHVPPNLVRLWCQNYNGSKHEKIKPLPIGFERQRWFPEQKKSSVLENYSYNKQTDLTKQHLVYMNFNTKTNKNRTVWYNELKDKEFVYEEMLGNGSSFENYIRKSKESHFVLSPEGNGIDCHRNWECLKIGSIPIIPKSNFANEMFSDLPVLLIDDVKEITKERLLEFLIKKDKDSNLEKLTCDYWKKLIMKDVKKY